MTLKKYFLSSAIFLCLIPAYAQTEEVTEVAYVVQPGDTLINISTERLDSPERWRVIAEAENIKNPMHLQPGQVISLPVDLLKYESKLLTVAFERGENNVVQGNTSKPLARGMRLSEGQVVRTGDDGFVSLELADGSRLYLSANSALRIKQFRYVPEVDKELVDFVLEQGHVETSVTPQAGNSRFRVSTPLVVTGVRGTSFGVSFDQKNKIHTNDVIEGSVGLVVADEKKITTSQLNQAPEEVLLKAGSSAILTASMTTPQVDSLLPAPDLSAWSKFMHTATWEPEALTGATPAGYLVRAYPEGDSDGVLFESRGALTPIGPIKQDGVYILQVRALDENDIPGYPAQHVITVKTKPEAPLPQAPANGAELPASEQNLVCTNTPKIQRYFLQVASDENFTNIIEEKVSNNNCSFSLSIRELGGYYWRVAAMDETSRNVDAARGEFSAVGSFVVVLAPAVPDAQQNFDGDKTVLRWAEAVPDSEYVVEISDDQSFATTLFTHKTKQTEATIELPSSCNALYVRVQSISPQGFESDFSSTRVLQGTPTWCTGDGTLLVDTQGDPIVIY